MTSVSMILTMKFVVVLLCFVTMSLAFPDVYGAANEMRRTYPNGPDWAQSYDVKTRVPSSEVNNNAVGGVLPRVKPVVSTRGFASDDTSWMYQTQDAYMGPMPKYDGKKELNFPIHHQRRPPLPVKPIRRRNYYY